MRIVPWMMLTAILAASTPAAALNSVEAGKGKEPQIAIDPGGHVYIVYGSGTDVYCVNSMDGGKSYSQPVHVASVPGMPLGMRRGPRVACTEKSVVVTAISMDKSAGKPGEVLCFTSTDAGKTWARSAKPINSVQGSACEGLHNLAGAGDDRLYCVWLDSRNMKKEVWGAFSSNGGRTWENETMIYKSPDGGTCPCCHPSVALDAKGNVHVMFRNDLSGDKDMYYARSMNGGKTFESAQKLGGGSWKLQACPMDGGGIALAGESAYTIWRRQTNIFAAPAGQPERQLGAGQQPVVAVGPGGAYFSWISARGGPLTVLAPNAQPFVATDKATDPSIAAQPGGKGLVVLAWEKDNTVLAAVVNAR